MRIKTDALFLISLMLFTRPILAGNILAALDYWTLGATTLNQATYASFKGAGKTGTLYLAARGNGARFMKINENQWTPWNNRTASLRSIRKSSPLQAIEKIQVAEQLSGLAVNFNIFAGYIIDGNVHDNVKPFSVSELPGWRGILDKCLNNNDVSIPIKKIGAKSLCPEWEWLNLVDAYGIWVFDAPAPYSALLHTDYFNDALRIDRHFG